MSEQGTQQEVIMEMGRKGGYVPVTHAGGPPPGDQVLAQHPQAAPSSPSQSPVQPQAHVATTQQKVG